MLNLQLSITAPWCHNNFKNLFCLFWRTGKLLKHKAWEFEVIQDWRVILNFTFRWTVRRDHAGPTLELGLFGYEVYLMMYDTRHWCDRTNTWEVYTEM
jgi:hypothetical protein